VSHVLHFYHPLTTTPHYSLSLHDALPIFALRRLDERRVEFAEDLLALPHQHLADLGQHDRPDRAVEQAAADRGQGRPGAAAAERSEEHTSELQSHLNLVCRLLLEKQKHKS